MICIRNLCKTYFTKRKKKNKALNDINLVLPDTGLVFVVGKSGSGKSTLLNLIGGLDDITEGSIVVDGNDLAKFKEKSFCDYRNSHVGFIFQDYHLVEDLTVYENIVLSLDLKRIEDKDLVKKALEKVDLSGYEDRYPNELSGGEQQRVAIARAIVKEPKIILADEPTGNLDFNTAKAIISLLKELSKECLILIVSHNTNDAYYYADRIVELSRGKIISDKSKNTEFKDEIIVSGDKLIYPDRQILTDKDIELLNENTNKKIVRKKDKFIETKEMKINMKKSNIEKNNLSIKNELKLSGKFLKNKTLAISLSSFMVSVIMVILSLAQTIINFDSGKVIREEMNKGGQSALLLNKVLDEETQMRLEKKYRVEIGEKDIQQFYDGGYKGKIYPVYNTTLPITECRNILGINSSYFSDNIYIKESLGTIVVDEQFFLNKFGEIKYLAKSEHPKDGGLIITDYLADGLLKCLKTYKNKDYSDLLGHCVPCNWGYDGVEINAIIDTDYDERNNLLFDKIKQGYFKKSSDYYEDEDFLKLSNEIYEYLGYTYSLDPTYIEKAYLTKNFCSHGIIEVDGKVTMVDDVSPYINILDSDAHYLLKGKKATMGYNEYNELFNTSYNSTNLDDFVPHTINFTFYRYYDLDKKEKTCSFELMIEGLYTSNDTLTILKGAYPEIEKLILEADTYAYSLYFDGTEGIETVLDNAESMNYQPQSFSVEGVHTMTKAVDVFIPIFRLIGIILCVGIVFILVNFSSKMINDKMHEIGIMKALGTKNISIAIIFGLQVVLIAALTCLLSSLGYLLFIDIANDVLIQSLTRLAPSRVVLDLNFLIFIPRIAFENCLLIIILTIASTIIPLIKIKKIEPVKIIKAKD